MGLVNCSITQLIVSLRVNKKDEGEAFVTTSQSPCLSKSKNYNKEREFAKPIRLFLSVLGCVKVHRKQGEAIWPSISCYLSTRNIHVYGNHVTRI